ncbi:tetratricopeptide (TPR) repeat protein [Rhizobium sp. BK181]|uniref:NB-ARC domain-containing protein n=1 Tax=Rhizobium sp. BK181 TaxID=2587072 RepID=UPI00161E026F|nr:NB-ARC domain-containing protein [Rhizobium sp. BK181]MBB3319936.1 tetratricopeptide (TPR) repeat protein [Rhizobium sp. BK181]
MEDALALLNAAASVDVPTPAPLPSGSVLPWSPNPTFKGRDDDLKELAEFLLRPPSTKIVPTVAVTGLGGVGKTQLAAEFAHRYAQYFKGGVFWISCGEPEAIPSQLAACGWGLNLHPTYADLDLPDQLILLRYAWQRMIPRLLILDACEDERTLSEWRPTTGGARVLLTSRRHDWDPALGVTPIGIRPLQREDSISLLRNTRSDLTADDPALNAISEELGDLPLALHLASLFLAKFRHSALGDPDKYLHALRGAPVLRHRSMTAGGWSPTGHEQHIARTFALSYDQLRSEGELGEMARALLRFASHFAPGVPIPRYTLSPSEAPGSDPAILELQEEAVLRLAEVGIIHQLPDGSLVLHQLVAAFSQLEPPPAGSAAEDVENYLIYAARSVNTIADSRLLIDLEPHIIHAATSAAKRGDINAVKLYRELGETQYARGTYTEARATFERALALSATIAGSSDESRAIVLNIAVVDRITGNVEAAIERQRESLALLEASSFGSEFLIGKISYNLGRALLSRAPDEAAALFDKAARIAEEESVPGEELEDLDTSERKILLINALTGLAEARLISHQPNAQSEAEKAISIAEEVFGPDAFVLWRPLYVLGEIFRLKKDFKPAVRCLFRSKQLIVERQGDDSPLLGEVLISLGQAQYSSGYVAGAKETLERAVDTTDRSTGLEYSGLRPAIEALSRIYLEEKDFGSCRRLLEQEVATIATTSGDRENLAIVLCTLGIACAALGDREAALRNWKRSRRLVKQMKGPGWQDILRQLQRWINGR